VNDHYAPSSAPLREPPPQEPPRARRIPFSHWYPVAMGAAAGVVLRLLFWGTPNNAFSTMLVSFIYGSPFIVGMVTVYIAEREERRTWMYYLVSALIATTLYVVGTLLIMVEGWICAIVILPAFALLGVFGGLVMGFICRATNWPRGRIISALVALVFAGGALEHRLPTPDHRGLQQRSLFIAASPDDVWRQLVDTRRIRPDEVNGAWMYRIGVPVPKSGNGGVVDGRHVRHITMGRGVHFDQEAVEWRPGERVTWRYRFAPDSFPAGALDDHVRIGGAYFDLGDTTYALHADGAGTRLTITMRYRVSTHFNFYAVRVADFLVRDFADNILRFYARRAEAPRIQPGS
jgi:hypothetical protein